MATTFWLEKKKAPDLSQALTNLLDGTADYSLAEPPGTDSPDKEPDAVGLIPWFSLRAGAFTTDLCVLWKQGCRNFIVVSPAEERKPWQEPDLRLPAHIRAAFDDGVPVWDEPKLDGLKKAIGEIKSGKAWSKGRIQQFVEARILYDDYLYRLSHNSRTDLSNQFLAPARLLRLGNASIAAEVIQKWKTEIWEGKDSPFLEANESKVTAVAGVTGCELVAAGKKIGNSLNANPSSAPEVSDLENVMNQITRIRETAGLRTGGTGGTGSSGVDSAIPVGELSATYRILVVDDHASAWRPVFEQLQKTLAIGVPAFNVRFEFSLDGKQICSEKAESRIPADFSKFDLVVLDVFLGGSRGTDTLKRLRRDFSQLPVLLWTTSRDEEITAEATLANGILLKKTVTWDQLESAIRTWVPHGKAMRTTTLPNPFFNHAIKNLECRKLAVDFHEWCLKQLDSFHALDGEYFRFFTDHGGRHIVKLWELLEHALQPFLQDDKQNLFPEDEKQRELEILGLYLTVICHELGMFPMQIGNEVENFATLGRNYLDDVRSLHAVRGMVLLHDQAPRDEGCGAGKYWNDSVGAQLGKRLREVTSGVAERLAVLVGYHARVFKSLSDKAFLNWEVDETKKVGAKHDLDGRLAKLASPVPSLSRTGAAFEETFKQLAAVIGTDAGTRNRLRRQCAFFRFVDALDITASRNPAEFLVGSGKLRAQQHGENLKRELCDYARIEDSEVRVKMRPPSPELELVKKIIESVPKLMKKKDKPSATAASKFLGLQNAAQRVKEPWSLDLPSAKDDDARLALLQTESVLILQKPLDTWLTNVWEVLKGNGGKDAFVKELQDMGVLDSTSQEPTLVLRGAIIIAQITALSVAGELLDEYQAIVEGGLSDRIRLVPFGWGGARDWSKLPAGLTTLKNTLPDEETT